MQRFAYLSLRKASVEPFISFREYLYPNELRPGLLKNIFDSVSEGVLLSTGTERTFIGAALYEKCEGLIGVDINPRVKAYNDFNMLLISLAESREDYLKLRATDEIIALIKTNNARRTRSTFDPTDSFNKIRSRLDQSELADEIKGYFRENLNDYGRVFYEAQQLDKMLTLLDSDLSKDACCDFTCFSLTPPQFFANANYLYDDKLFQNIKNLVVEGNVMFVTGDINELDDFSQVPIKCIDSSNISDYVKLDFARMQFLVDNGATHIWTKYQGVGCQYHSQVIEKE